MINICPNCCITVMENICPCCGHPIPCTNVIKILEPSQYPNRYSKDTVKCNCNTEDDNEG